MKRSAGFSRFGLFLSLLAAALGAVVLYILLHEGGHALVALLCGAKPESVNLAQASVSYAGGSFTAFTAALRQLMGPLLPWLCAVALMLACPVRRVSHMAGRLFLAFFPLLGIAAFLPWVIYPFLYLRGGAPEGADLTLFLSVSGLSPAAVALSVGVLLIGSLIPLFIKRIPQELCRTFRQLRNWAIANPNFRKNIKFRRRGAIPSPPIF